MNYSTYIGAVESNIGENKNSCSNRAVYIDIKLKTKK